MPSIVPESKQASFQMASLVYRDYAAGYYAAFLLDPDRNNIEALYRDVGNPGYAG
jgi:hypothetical protein